MFDNPLLFFICSLGVFNGFLVSVYFLLINKTNRVPNFLFGLLVLFLTVRIGKSVYTVFTPREERNLLVIQIGLSACFLIGVSLYFYLKSSVEKTKKISLKWKLHFLLLLMVITIIGVIKPYAVDTLFWNTYFVKFIYLVWGIYVVLSSFILKDVFRKFFSKKDVCNTAEVWLIAVFCSNLLIYLAYIVGYFYFYFVGTVTFSLVFYGLVLLFISKKNRESIFRDLPEKYSAKKIKNNEADLLKLQLDSLMKEQELYKDTAIKLSDISTEIGVSPHKLSQFLNDNLGKSFAFFLNEYRVNEAKRLLRENHKITLESIGFEAGFSSKSNFYATFKKVVGKTPAQYQKQFLTG
ncbi:Transcriptional regulator, AraC family protein [Tenacibaculum sediminilitoris]|uniref:helix-turn-helix domain-containing protein n=1 Tax=Tenacibaculum sediminilitoris TaxID=1820334 RepID=UPI003893E3CA